jgi:hypothetical protein
VNLAICGTLPRTPENGVWFRLIPPGHLSTALSSAHSKVALSRFSAGRLLPATSQFAALYFADDPMVAQFEVGAVLGSPTPGGHIPHPRLSFVSMNVHIILQEAFDLTDVPGAQVPLSTNVQELTGDWKGYTVRNHATPVASPTGVAPTQALGEALFRTGIEGFRAVSARVPYNKTLTVFPDNLQPMSSLTFKDQTGAVVHRIHSSPRPLPDMKKGGPKAALSLARSMILRFAVDRGASAAMSQADAENSRLSPKRPLGSFHLLRDLR